MSDPPSATHAPPTEIRLRRQENELVVSFADGTSAALSAEMLRVLSPSAEVQGHSPAQRVTVPGKRNVKLVAVEPVGRYAVRLRFDDGHDTGLFTWDYLHRLCTDTESLWQAYLDELAEKGLNRDLRF